MDVKNVFAKCQYNPYFPRENEVLTYREFVGRLSEAASYDARFMAKNKNLNRKPKSADQIARKMQALEKRNVLANDHMAAYAKKHNIPPRKTMVQRIVELLPRAKKKKNIVYAC
jgi:hypothetical protein